MSEPLARTVACLSFIIGSFNSLALLEKSITTVQEEQQTLLRYATLPRCAEKLLDDLYLGTLSYRAFCFCLFLFVIQLTLSSTEENFADMVLLTHPYFTDPATLISAILQW